MSSDLTVRLPLFDSDGNEVSGYMEADVDLFLALSRAARGQGAKVVEPEEAKVTYKTQRVDISDEPEEEMLVLGAIELAELRRLISDRNTKRKDIGAWLESVAAQEAEQDKVEVNFDSKEFTFSSRSDASVVLDGLNDMADRYGKVSVADFHDLVGIVSQYTDTLWGWSRKDFVYGKIQRTRDGYTVLLPHVSYIRPTA